MHQNLTDALQFAGVSRRALTMNSGALLRRFLLSNDPTIEALHLEGYRIGTQTVRQVANVLATNKTLEELSLSFCTEACAAENYERVQAIANALRQNTALNRLCFYDCAIDANCARALAEALTVNATLVELELIATPIHDEGAQAIAHMLRQRENAINVYLEWTAIGDAGAAALERAMRHNATAHLDIHNNLRVSSLSLFRSIEHASLRNMKIRCKKHAHRCRVISIYCTALLIQRTKAQCALQACIGRDVHQSFQMIMRTCTMRGAARN